jgi:ankyrin repeat protein
MAISSATKMLFNGLAGMSPEAVKASIEAGADVDARDESRGLGQTPAIMAASLGDVESLRRLIAAGADLSAWDVRGRTPSAAAAFAGRIKCLRVLRAAGAPIEAPEPGHMSAAMCAALCGRTSCLELLLDWGCRIDLVDSHGNDLRMLSHAGGDPNCMRMVEARVERDALAQACPGSKASAPRRM